MTYSLLFVNCALLYVHLVRSLFLFSYQTSPLSLPPRSLELPGFVCYLHEDRVQDLKEAAYTKALVNVSTLGIDYSSEVQANIHWRRAMCPALIALIGRQGH